MVQPEEFKEGMRALIAGVTVITSGEGDDRRGLTATSVCSLTVDPPMLVACVNRRASTHETIKTYGSFVVNLLTVDQVEFAKVFSDPGRVADRFRLGQWTTLKTGAPVLADSAVSFDCRVHDTLAVSTHTIFVGEVAAIQSRSDASPLAYGAAQWGRFQFGIE